MWLLCVSVNDAPGSSLACVQGLGFCQQCVLWHARDRQIMSVQESLADGCKHVDEVVESFADVGIKDRSMVWNTDLIEVPAPSSDF